MTISARDNDYELVEAEDPTGEHSVGIDQDGTDFSYFIEVKFGAEEKPLYMLLDTGASTTWVMGHDCASEACTKHNSFGPDDSSTLKDTGEGFSIMYGTGKVSGNVVTDSISVADITTTLNFGLANTTSEEFSRFPFEGIMGMSTSKDSFFSAIKEAGVLEANVIGVSLSRASDGVNDGEISFGALNEDKYEGDITYADVISDDSWAVTLDDVVVDGNSAGLTGKTAYLDTGTTYAFAPPDQVRTLFSKIAGASSSDGTTYTIPCDSKVPVAFTFSGKSWDVSMADLISAPVNGKCTANIFGMEIVKGSWLLGDMFLKNVYSVYDMDKGRIGEFEPPHITKFQIYLSFSFFLSNTSQDSPRSRNPRKTPKARARRRGPPRRRRPHRPAAGPRAPRRPRGPTWGSRTRRRRRPPRRRGSRPRRPPRRRRGSRLLPPPRRCRSEGRRRRFVCSRLLLCFSRVE